MESRREFRIRGIAGEVTALAAVGAEEDTIFTQLKQIEKSFKTNRTKSCFQLLPSLSSSRFIRRDGSDSGDEVCTAMSPGRLGGLYRLVITGLAAMIASKGSSGTPLGRVVRVCEIPAKD